jgi:hypothetical protein
MEVAQRPVIFHHQLEGHVYQRIHTKLVATDGRNAHAEDSVKYWVCEHDDGRSPY